MGTLIEIGKNPVGNKPAEFDLDKLISSRLLIQANSGGGKSWAMRRLLEQTHNSVQQIVIDVEDEFYTLREDYDYILVRTEDGDCAPDIKNAAMLAEKLLELGLSAIVSIYELKAYERVTFVKRFVDALVNAPKKLWHPCLVTIDEAHVFCPQTGKAESAGSIIDLMTRGRKRGFCGVLATQRISKLHKDAAAEANNKLIGRAAQDVDMKRAADELGFSGREDIQQLRLLKPGEFYTFGPAISDLVEKIKVGDVKTTHPKSGQAMAPVAPPKHKVEAVLDQLSKIPSEAKEKSDSIDALKKSNASLRRELTLLKKSAGMSKEEVESLISENLERQQATLQKKFQTEHDALVRSLEVALRGASSGIDTALSKLESSSGKEVATKIPKTVPIGLKKASNSTGPLGPVNVNTGRTPDPVDLSGVTKLGKCPRELLRVFAQFPEGRTRSQLSILSGYSIKSSGFANALSQLRTSGFIEGGGGDVMMITPDGVEAAGDVPPVPEGSELARYWMGKLGKCERALFQALLENQEGLTRDHLATISGYSSTSSGFANSLSKLNTLELIRKEGDEIFPNEMFGDYY